MTRKIKSFLLPLLILLILFATSWRFIDYFFKHELLDQQEEYLEKKGTILTSQLSLTENESLTSADQTLLKEFIAGTKERITLLDANGEIRYDSFKENLQGSRSTRPEVKEVLEKHRSGTALRFSTTLKEELLYVALPVKNNDQFIGILRLAEPTKGFNQNAEGFHRSILIVLAIFYLLLSLLICYLIWQKNRPIANVLPVLKRMATNPEKVNFILQDSSQWQDLYQTINQLSEKMQETYTAYASTEEQFKTLLHDLPLGVMIINEQGRIELLNPAMKNFLGIGTAEQLPYWEVIEDPKLLQLLNQVKREAGQLHKELTLSKPQALTLDILLRALESPNGEKQLMGIFYDLSRVRNLEKIQRDFVGNVSHELKTPVTSLIGFTETLLDGAKDDPETTTEFLKIMQKDAQRLQSLIQDIIQLSKDDAPAINEKLVIVMGDFLQELIKSYQLLITTKNLTVEVSGDSQLIYETQLEFFQPIIKNLLENALQYSLENEKVQLTYYLDAEHFYFSVQDFGLGIDHDDQERIFERFYRVDKARTRYSGGTGLGLAIVKEYTEILKGTITVKSYLGVGTTFTLTLPRY